MTPQQLVEFGWGLANSKFMFPWIIRPDLVVGDSSILPPELLEEIKGRGLIASWCPQEEECPCFVGHSLGINKQIDTCNEWGIGMEIDNGAKRGEVEKIVRELMEGNKGNKMKKKAMEWKKLAEEATGPHGSSSINLDNLVNEVLLSKG
ncbi:(R)-mandelonitrile beta-glucosyltransferase-like [Alnus glutinosa]|uniref:(R)-mandelonitrile beta-glucosyltransferase-like n=1 Tax=Alnus glutinosa TaxID=3517 RepID=UPI002D77358E|nr:(R)-mandelonitrile beta-glucosyltransferase-like [Alnus glutinosa]